MPNRYSNIPLFSSIPLVEDWLNSTSIFVQSSFVCLSKRSPSHDSICSTRSYFHPKTNSKARVGVECQGRTNAPTPRQHWMESMSHASDSMLAFPRSSTWFIFPKPPTFPAHLSIFQLWLFLYIRNSSEDISGYQFRWSNVDLSCLPSEWKPFAPKVKNWNRTFRNKFHYYHFLIRNCPCDERWAL